MTSSSFTEILANLSISWILAIVAVLTAVRISLVRIPSARSTVEFLESAIVAIVLVYMIIRPFVVQAFFIPSASMVPTLLGNHNSGDRILVNKFVYREHRPQRDDVVVFIAPKEATMDELEATPSDDPIDFIKRLIAQPGDKLQIVAGKVIINGLQFSHADIREKLAMAGDFGGDTSPNPDLFDHHVKFTDNGVLANGKLISNSRLAEVLTGVPNAAVVVEPGYTLLNAKRLTEPFIAEDPDYDCKIYQGMPLRSPGARWPYELNGQPISQEEYDRDNLQPTGAIPPHHFFMMGDNRNDSADSTEWGPLDENRVVGKAQFIFWPLSRVGAIR